MPRQEILKSALDEWRAALGPRWEKALAAKEIFWTNMWPAKDSPVNSALSATFYNFCQSLLPEHFPIDDVAIDGIGFIVNPVGSRQQAWHLDYTRDYATVFIPLTAVTPENATQYVVLSPSTPLEAYARATSNLDKVDLEPLLAGAPHITVCQKLARPFSVLKMDFETIHRGIANTGSFHRINFFYSVRRRGSDAPAPDEGLIVDFVQ